MTDHSPTAQPADPPAPKPTPAGHVPRRQRIVIVAAAVTIALGMGYLAFRPAPPIGAVEHPTGPMPVTANPAVAASGYVERRAHIGRVEAARTSRVGGELGGAVSALLVDEGDQVRARQPIARFDTTRLAARRAQLVADRERQKAVLAELRAGPRVEDIEAQEANVRRLLAAAALAKSTASRVHRAFAEQAVAQQEWDEARLRAEQAKAAAEAAKAKLDELRTGTRKERIAAQVAAVRALDAAIHALDVDIAKAVVLAPFAGRISTRFVDEGEVLTPGTPLVEIREEASPSLRNPNELTGAREIRVGVLPEFAENLRTGSAIPIRVRGREASATVVAVRNDRSVRTRTVPVLLRMRKFPDDKVGIQLRDGELVEVMFDRRIETSGFWLPLSALSEGTRGLWRCFVLEGSEAKTKPQTLAARTVEVVHFDQERAFVRGALRDGELVATSGSHQLVPGLEVHPVGGKEE